MNKWLGFIDSQHLFLAIVTPLVLLLGGLFGYILLQGVSRPYWIPERDIRIGQDFYENVTVINPGPWRARKPCIEFPLGSVEVVGYSAGVTVSTRMNKICVCTDDELPAGSLFSITYKYSADGTNGVPRPDVVCDGKRCKNDPTFDLDLELNVLSMGGLITLLLASFGSIMYFKTKDERDQARMAIGNQAKPAEARSDVEESRRSLERAGPEVQEIKRNVKPTPVGKNGKKPKRNGNGGTDPNPPQAA